MRFRRALLTAGQNAVGKGELTRGQFRSLRIASIRPVVCLAMHDEIVLQGICTGVIVPSAADHPGEIDWEGLLDFLSELLPMILEFIEALLILF